MGLIIFLGDSITAADREESSNELGCGYVNIFSETLKTKSGLDYSKQRRCRLCHRTGCTDTPHRMYFTQPGLCKYSGRYQ